MRPGEPRSPTQEPEARAPNQPVMRKLAILIAAAGLWVHPAGADTAAVAAAGSGTFLTDEGTPSCLTIGGVTADTGVGASRSRWLGAYWASAEDAPNGVCSEEEEHADLRIECATALDESSGTVYRTLYARTIGTDGVTYLVKVIDNPYDFLYPMPDEVGVAALKPADDAPLCGAADVPTHAVADGQFSVSAFP